MFQRIKSRIYRGISTRFRKNVPFQEQTTIKFEGNNFFEPSIVGPSTFIADCTSVDTIEKVFAIYERLASDEFLSTSMSFYREGIKRFGKNWKYADIATVLYGISSCIRIQSYLEIGVRKGRSMAIVASLNPDAEIVGFDLWMPNYCGIDNPGDDHVIAELKKIGYKGRASFISGNSCKTVPNYFGKNPNAYFDLITVDGGHSFNVAKTDLKNVIPRLKIGGILVFDDINNHFIPDCKLVWKKCIENNSRFKTFSFTEIGYGVGFAIKLY